MVDGKGPADGAGALPASQPAAIIRSAPEHKLAGARRKAVTLRMLRAAAFQLQAT